MGKMPIFVSSEIYRQGAYGQESPTCHSARRNRDGSVRNPSPSGTDTLHGIKGSESRLQEIHVVALEPLSRRPDITTSGIPVSRLQLFEKTGKPMQVVIIETIDDVEIERRDRGSFEDRCDAPNNDVFDPGAAEGAEELEKIRFHCCPEVPRQRLSTAGQHVASP